MTVTTAIIREMVDLELLERGMTMAHRRHSNLGLPMWDVEQIITNANKENSNTTHNPESVNLTIAETILKEFALRRVFTDDVAEAHLVGDIHLHDLGFIIRPYCGGHSPRVHQEVRPQPPQHHQRDQARQARRGAHRPHGQDGERAAGSLRRRRRLGGRQRLLRSLPRGQDRGGARPAGTDAHLRVQPARRCARQPGRLHRLQPLLQRTAPLRGYSGDRTGRTVHRQDLPGLRAGGPGVPQGDVQRLHAGRRHGKTFVFPKPLLHISEDFFRTPGHEDFLDLACQVASKQGITYFVFDRGDEVTVSQCCRLKLKLSQEQLRETRHPEKMRFSALQNVTINLPAHRVQGPRQRPGAVHGARTSRSSSWPRPTCRRGSSSRDSFDLGAEGPLGLLTQELDGSPYLKMDRLTYLAGLIGLNELVQVHTGEQLHESDAALRFGLKVISCMNLKCKELSERHGINLVLEESPAESAGYRLAKLDMKYWPRQDRRGGQGRSVRAGTTTTRTPSTSLSMPMSTTSSASRSSRASTR